MRLHQFVAAVLACLVSSCACAGEGAQIFWESYKDVEFDFGDNLLRASTDHQLYAFATGEAPSWAATDPHQEPIDITSPITTGVESIHSAPERATASALGGWFLSIDEFEGSAHLANSTAGTTSIDDKFDPTVVAMSWGSHTTSIEFGQEVTSGSINWSPGIQVGTGGGAFLSSYDTISIHDPIVVWTRGEDGQLRDPRKVFELNAVFDEATEFRWNEVRRITSGIDGPELQPIINDGPFLDATRGGSGSFTISLQSDLLPVNQRGTISLEFEDGVVTDSRADGVFAEISPIVVGPASEKLPTIGSPAFIDKLLPPSPTSQTDRFDLALAVSEDNAELSNVAACSDGVHVSVGPAIDTVQSFTLNPIQRKPLARPQPSVLGEDAGTGSAANACLGEFDEDAELLFGTEYVTRGSATLHRDVRTSPIDRVLRLTSTHEQPSPGVLFHRGENNRSPDDTRRWNVRFDVRPVRTKPADDDLLPPVEPVDPVPVEPVPVEPAPVEPPAVAPAPIDGVVEVSPPRTPLVASRASGSGEPNADGKYVVAVLDEAALLDLADDAGNFDLDKITSEGEHFVVTMTDHDEASHVQLFWSGELIGEKKLLRAPTDVGANLVTRDPWSRFELGLLEAADGVQVTLRSVHPSGRTGELVVRRTVPKIQLSDFGYRLALGVEGSVDSNSVVDFDNLMTTFQRNGDLAWDGKLDRSDFQRVRNAIEAEAVDQIFDVNMDGEINIIDLEAIEDLIPNKKPGDANLDGFVTFGDFLALSDSFGEKTGLWSRGDFDSNGEVDFPDFLILSRNYEEAPSDSARPVDAVPEPSGLSLLVAGLIVCGLRLSRSSRRNRW